MTSRSVRLTDLLPDDALREILESRSRGTLTIASLKAITARYKDELEAKGVLDTYLAYVIAHMLGIYP